MRDLPSSADDILRAFFDTNTPILSSLDSPSSPSGSPNLPPLVTSSPSTPHPISPPSLSIPASSPLPSAPRLPPSPPRQPVFLPFPDSSGPHRSSRLRRQNVRLDDYVLSISVDDFDVCLTAVAPLLPAQDLTFSQAAQDAGWRAAMEDEMQSIHKNHTWDLVPLSLEKKAITSKWVYKTKPGLHGDADRLKARLVARGFE